MKKEYSVNITATTYTYEKGDEDGGESDELSFLDIEFETAEEANAFVRRIMKLVDDEKIKHIDWSYGH